MHRNYTFAYFFWILSSIKIKFGQILAYLTTNISNMFLAQFWNHETNSRPFYYSNKMTMQEAPLIFDSFLEFLKIHSLLLSIEHGLSEVTPMSKFAPVDSSCCTHIFICMPIWFADIVSHMKKCKQRNLQQAIFTTTLQYLISLFIFKGLSTNSLRLL